MSYMNKKQQEKEHAFKTIEKDINDTVLPGFCRKCRLEVIKGEGIKAAARFDGRQFF